MVTTEKEEKSQIKLSCRESGLILRTIPLCKNLKEMREEEIAGIRHYFLCKKCRDKGLSEILETPLTCQEALLVWAEQATALWMSCDVGIRGPRFNSLMELYAVEHVWGKYEWQKTPLGGHGWEGLGGCPEDSCRSLNCYWINVPMSSGAGDGADGVIRLMPFMIEVFLEQAWPLGKLFTIQRKRIDLLVQNIKTGRITVSSGHYNSIDELKEELRQHINVLQKTATRIHSSGLV